MPMPARVLEVSCGRGELLALLRKDGYETLGTNYSRYDDADASLTIDKGVDIKEGLPYQDGAFDAVIAMDVIEHISDHKMAASEFARVTRPGGYTFILTPNIMKISSRLGFFFTGFHKTKRKFIGFDVSPEKSFPFHNYPPHLPTFLYELHAHGLESVDVDAVQFKPKGILFWLLFAPLIVPATWLKAYRGEKNLRSSGASRLVSRHLASFKMLCGESAIYVNRKVDLARQLQPPSQGPREPESEASP